MRKFLTLVLFVALSGLGLQLAAQQQPQEPGNQSSSQQQPPPADQAGSQQQQTDASRQSAETLQGKIARAGDQFVFQEAKSQTTFQIDDQARVALYEGKSVKLTATVDPKTTSLHVVDVAPSDK